MRGLYHGGNEDQTAAAHGWIAVGAVNQALMATGRLAVAGVAGIGRRYIIVNRITPRK